LRVGAPDVGGIDIYLDRVAIRVVEVDALRHRVILDRVDPDAERVEVRFGPAKIIDRVADLESDMVLTGAVRRRVRRVRSERHDGEVMVVAESEERHRWRVPPGRNLQPENLGVEAL
jgi:hypothetical protein